jgi:hypothetical protein
MVKMGILRAEELRRSQAEEKFPSLNTRGMNDRISSILVNDECLLEGWHDDNFSGGKLELRENHPDIQFYENGWNDVLSSVKCTCVD